MTDVQADAHELKTGEFGIASDAKGLNYFIKKQPYGGAVIGTLIGISARDGITYLTPAQAKAAALELAGIVEQYC